MNELDQLKPESTLSEMQQVVFIVVVRGLRSQQWKQSVKIGYGLSIIAWFGEDGCKCALGHLMEGPPQRLMWDRFYPPLRAWWVANGYGPAEGLTSYLMAAHDESPLPGEMERRVRKLGAKYNLKWPEEPQDEAQNV